MEKDNMKITCLSVPDIIMSVKVIEEASKEKLYEILKNGMKSDMSFLDVVYFDFSPIDFINHYALIAIRIDERRTDLAGSKAYIHLIKEMYFELMDMYILPPLSGEDLDKFIKRKDTYDSSLAYKINDVEPLEITTLKKYFINEILTLDGTKQLLANIEILIEELTSNDIFVNSDLNFLYQVLNGAYLDEQEYDAIFVDTCFTCLERNEYLELIKDYIKTETSNEVNKLILEKYIKTNLLMATSDETLTNEYMRMTYMINAYDDGSYLIDQFKYLFEGLNDYHWQGLREFGFIDAYKYSLDI